MTTSDVKPGERVKDVHVDDYTLTVNLIDGRTITVPLVWYPRLLHATSEQRANWQVSGAGYGIHWPDLDEDLSTEGLLRGAPAPRRANKPTETKKIRVKDIEIDLKGRRVTKAGKPIELTYIQFKLLSLLAARRNNVISRKEILEMVKGKQIRVTNQTVDVSIKKLQEKLGEQNIKKVNGVGYLLV